MNTSRSSVLTYIIAVLVSGMAFLLTLVLILEFEYPNLERGGVASFHPVAIAMLFCAALGAFFGGIRPDHSLRLALLASSAFWGFFFIIFVCYLLNGEIDWVPVGQALLTACSALIGALFAGKASTRLWRREASAD